MGSSVKVVRDRARVAHLLEAAVLIAYIYTPLMRARGAAGASG